MKIDLNKVMTTLVIAALLAMGGTVWDFQSIKANVLQQESKIHMIYSDLKEIKRDVKSLLRRR